LEQKPARLNHLMDEVASIACPRGRDALPVQLDEVSLSGVAFISPTRLDSHGSDAFSLRFSLPGKPRLHFALVKLMAPPIHLDSGFRYTAKFMTIDPHTVDHIVEHLGSALAEASGEGCAQQPAGMHGLPPAIRQGANAP